MFFNRNEEYSMLFLSLSVSHAQIHLCCGSDSVAKAAFSLNPLASKDTLQSNLKLNLSELCTCMCMAFVLDDLYRTLQLVPQWMSPFI